MSAIRWILQINLGLMYIVAGLSKLAGNASMVSLFQAIGVGQWFRYAVGATETTGGLLLFTPTWSGLAAVLLCPVMVGAIATGFLVPGESPLPAAAALAGLVAVAWLRRAETIRAVKAAIRR